MTIFHRPRTIWGRKPTEDATPAPFAAGALSRQCVLLPEVAAVLDHLPTEGGATHIIMDGRHYDLMQLLVAFIDRLGGVETMRISTLSFHASNLRQMLGLLDRGQVKTLNLLACTFFRNTNKGLFVQTQQEFRQRGQRVAVSRTHAKVVTLAVADGSRWTIEGSSNLRRNDCWENAAIICSATVHDFHARWIDHQIANHEGDQVTGGATR